MSFWNNNSSVTNYGRSYVSSEEWFRIGMVLLFALIVLVGIIESGGGQ